MLKDLKRWRFLFFIIILVNLFGIVGMYVLSTNMAPVLKGFIENEHMWGVVIKDVNKTVYLASKVNAPGNDIFDSKNIATEKNNLEKAVRSYQSQSQYLFNKLKSFENKDSAKIVLDQLELAQVSFNQMVEKGQQVLRFYEKNELEKASASMSQMDKFYNLYLVEMNKANDYVYKNGEDGHNLLKEKSDHFGRLNIAFVVLSACMIFFMSLYAYKVSNLLIDVAIDNDQLTYALNEGAISAVSDTHGKILSVSQGLCKVMGYKEEELIGRDHRIFKSGIHDREFFEDLWGTILIGKVWRGEICNKTKEGKNVWFDTNIIPIKNIDGNVKKFVALRFDITQQKSFQEKMAFTAKMSALGEMASGIAHEINNPLSVIHCRAVMAAEGLKNEQCKPEEAAVHMEKIISMVDRAAKIIKGLRTFSRNDEDMPFSDYSLKKLIEECVDLSSEKIKNSGVRLSVLPFEDIVIQCRYIQLGQVVINLINNSHDAIVTTPDAWIKIEVEQDLHAQKVKLSVTDSGNGIPKNILVKLMTPFFTTKEVGKGTGLGLSISKGIVENHQGRFYVDEKCPNTRFVIEIPLIQKKLQEENKVEVA